MTRGTFYLITDDVILESLEFNGDMYPEGYGDKAFKVLKKVDTIDGFKKAITKFNKKYYNYNYELVFEKPFIQTQDNALGNGGMFDNEEHTLINFQVDYYERFFSDWLFIKNLGSKAITTIDRDNNPYILYPGKTIRYNFGYYYDEEANKKEKD